MALLLLNDQLRLSYSHSKYYKYTKKGKAYCVIPSQREDFVILPDQFRIFGLWTRG